MKDRSGREALPLDWAMQHKIPAAQRVRFSLQRAKQATAWDAAKESVASVSPLQRPCPFAKNLPAPIVDYL